MLFRSDYQILLKVISDLNAAQAEAISINDQRYTAYTEIVKAGDHLEVNGVSIAPPIVIKAIGDPEVLESSLTLKGGIIWNMEQYYDYIIQLRQEKSISIPKLRKIIEFNYVKPVVKESD